MSDAAAFTPYGRNTDIYHHADLQVLKRMMYAEKNGEKYLVN
mgnify:FL=1